jgi:hypothetical protein
MLHAEILGNQERSTGVSEKPSIYESVIKTHRTSIKHPGYGNKGQIGLNVGSEAMNQFIQNTEIDNLHKYGVGKIAIPVKIENNQYKNDATLSRYENPSFLTTKVEDKQKPKYINVPNMPMISPNLQATSAKDVKMIKKKLNSAKSKKQKLNACNYFYINKNKYKYTYTYKYTSIINVIIITNYNPFFIIILILIIKLIKI